MAKKKKVRKHAKVSAVAEAVKYTTITAEVFFTDGERQTAPFYKLSDILNYVNQSAAERYADSVRIELFWICFFFAGDVDDLFGKEICCEIYGADPSVYEGYFLFDIDAQFFAEGIEIF